MVWDKDLKDSKTEKKANGFLFLIGLILILAGAATIDLPGGLFRGAIISVVGLALAAAGTGSFKKERVVGIAVWFSALLSASLLLTY